MGQYHHPVCIEAEEGLSPHSLGCGLKEGEQGFTRPGTPNAMVALVCARGGNMPADCSQSPLVGRWAGRRVLVQGDYADPATYATLRKELGTAEHPMHYFAIPPSFSRATSITATLNAESAGDFTVSGRMSSFSVGCCGW